MSEALEIESQTNLETKSNQGRRGIKIALISLHGLIRANDPELGRDADTGGQTKYVLELAAELARQSGISEVELITRQIIDAKVDDDYAKLEEPIVDKAKIVRIPFGPKRYLRKEKLWPYIEIFVDECISHFRRNGLPDVIHGHYADAGLAGAQLSRLLHIPYVFTGHSLGRVKRQRLTAGKANPERLEKTYSFTTRIEAEEIALETASMVVASTSQEVEQQYEIYDHYVPDRMEVIPPGVDLAAFRAPQPGERRERIDKILQPFLREPDKPIILSMARPDERKNHEMLVRVYGECAELQERANLVLVMGTREDIRELTGSQKTVLSNVLNLIDFYNLYGKIAYPKHHLPEDVPELYRAAAASRGVFINPALTEPFGLTLLEAAASGLPIVATNDGGPRDIIGHCQNGLLIDALDPESIRKALLRALTETDQWVQWSKQGLAGVHEHYSWKKHAQRYLQDINEILEDATTPLLTNARSLRRLPDFDRLIITDIDNTLTGDKEALAEFNELIRGHDRIGFGITTGRNLSEAKQFIAELGLPSPDVLDTSVGTQIHYGEHLTPDGSWQKAIRFRWEPEKVQSLLDAVPGLYRQSDKEQSEFKISYTIDVEQAPKLSEIKKRLREAKLRTRVIFSLGQYIDIIPVRGGSDNSLRHLLYKWGFAPEQLLVAGDSGNDEGMLKGRTLGVVVGNYSPELEKLRKVPRVYFAKGRHARGIIEGIEYYHFLDSIVIPNDRIE
jgi:sucrose-phosphate synthase